MSKCTALRKILETHTCRCWDIIYMHTSSHAHRIALHEIINSGLYQRYLSQFLPLKKDSPAQSCIESGLLSNSQPYIGGGGQPSVSNGWEFAGFFQSNLGVHQVIHFSSAVDGVPICEITCCSLWLEWKRADCLAPCGLFLPSFRGKLPTQTRVIYFYFCRGKMAVFPEVTGHFHWKSWKEMFSIWSSLHRP